MRFAVCQNDFNNQSLGRGLIKISFSSLLSSIFNISIVRLKYDYSIFHDNRVSIGASFGLFLMPISFSVKAAGQEDHSTKFTAPLPLLGLRTDFSITKKLFLKQNIEFLYISTSFFSGGLIDLSVYLEHKTFDHIAFGVGVNTNRLNISLKKPDSSIEFYGDIIMDYTGMLLYGRYYF